MVAAEDFDFSRWVPVSGDEAERLTQQLKIEIGSAHVLFKARDHLLVVARDTASDDVIAIDRRCNKELFIIHLTWQQGPDLHSGFPSSAKIAAGEILNLLQRKR